VAGSLESAGHAVTRVGDGLSVRDPWGTPVEVRVG
jgi:hypothetical protein